MDSSASLKVAVKHLFRHLHDPRALRKNALVRRYFQEVALGSLGSVNDDRRALAKIHEQIRRGAEYCRDNDVASGNVGRALRQHAIILRQCLGKRPIREVAAELGISYYHCYRERAAICRRVAEYIGGSNEAAVSQPGLHLDEFRLLVDHVKYRATFSSNRAAVNAFEEFVAVAPSVQQKIEALRAAAERSIDVRNVAWAEQAYARARSLIAENLSSAPDETRGVAEAHADLLGYTLAGYRGTNSRAFHLASRAVERLEPIHDNAAPEVRELYTESLIDLAIAFWAFGATETAYNHVVRAERSLCFIPATSYALRARVIASLWKLRNYLLLSASAYYPSGQRLEGIANAFQLAYGSGSIGEAVDALVLIAEHHAFAGNDDEALRAGRFAIFLAKQQQDSLMSVQVPLDIAVRLLSTRHWQYAGSLVREAQRSVNLDAYHRQLLSYFKAESVIRRRNFRAAFSLAKGTGDQQLGATLVVRTQLVAARAAYELERRREARSLIEVAIPAAESLHSAPILRDAYRVAARVTGDSKYERQASEVARLLAS